MSRWNSGVPLADAWRQFGDERQIGLQRRAAGTPSSLVFQQLITAGVFSQIVAGKLIAYGYCVAPAVSDGPVRIPADVFDQPTPTTWGDDIVEASGYRYERIRVFGGDEEEHSVGLDIDSRSLPMPTNSPGRRDTFELFKLVYIEMLEANPSIEALSAERLLPEFANRFSQRYPPSSGFPPPPTDRTLRKHLKRFWAEENGKNRKK